MAFITGTGTDPSASPTVMPQSGGAPATSPTTSPTTTADQRIYQQIEHTADLYPPQIYDLLSRYGRISTEYDTASAEFVGLSQFGRYPKDAKLFAIGVLPPSSNVTGKVLDRSASIASITGFADELALGGPATGGGLPGGTLPPDFWVKFVAMCQRLGVDPKALASIVRGESGFQTTAVAMRGTPPMPIAKGLNQLMRGTATSLGMSDSDFDTYELSSADNQIYWMEKFFAKQGVRGATAGSLAQKNFGGYQYSGNPPGVAYASMAYQRDYIAAHPGFVFPNTGHGPSNPDGTSSFQDLAYQQNPGFDTGHAVGAITVDQINGRADTPLPSSISSSIDAAIAALKGGADGSLTTGNGPTGGATTGDWSASGSSDAKTAGKTIDKTANKDLNLTDLGQAFQASQKAMINATKAAIDRMAKTPPLRLLVNPSSFRTSAEKIVSDGNYGRNGPIVEHWGDQQDKIEGSGKLAGFYAIDVNNAVGPGLTRTARNMSESYQNFLSLYLIYKNNGGVWLNSDPGLKIGPPSLSVVGSIYIYYDNILYIGSFDSFSINETDASPFTLEYSFSFTVRAWFLLDNVSDPSTTFGAPPFVPPNPVVNRSSSATPTTVSDIGLDKVLPAPKAAGGV